MGLIICTRLIFYYQDRNNFLHVILILTLVLLKLIFGGGVSRDFDSIKSRDFRQLVQGLDLSRLANMRMPNWEGES